MPAPSNDVPAAEPLLFSQLSTPSGSLAWTNIGATPDASVGETNEKSVWWTCYLVSRRPVFLSTRVYAVDPPGSRTNFDTVITLFTSASANQPGAVVATNNDYAGWSRESHLSLPYGVPSSGFYFIRVHGRNAAEGNFILRWGIAAKRMLTAKNFVRANDGLVFIAGLRQPSVDVGPTATSFVSADYGSNHPPGEYTVRYVNGTWRFGDGRIPNPGSIQDWVVTRYYGGSFLSIGYNQGVVPPHVPPNRRAPLTGINTPQWTSEEAQRYGWFQTPTVTGPTYRNGAYFVHSGGLITLEFNDTEFADNLPGSPLPGFLLYRVAPHFEHAPPPAFGSVTRFGDSGVTFRLRNTGHNAFTGVKVELLEYGGIITPSPAFVTLGTFGLATTTLSPFSYSLAQPGETRLTARLRISDSYGFQAQLMDVDLTPDLQKDGAVIVEPTGATGPPWRARFPIRNRGLGPTRDLHVTITPVGMTNATPLTQTIGVIGSRTSRYVEVEFTSPAGQPFTARLTLTDGPVTYAPLDYAAVVA